MPSRLGETSWNGTSRGLICIAAALLAGCAYFNALYNANRLFDRGRKEIRSGNESSGRTALAESIRKAERALERNPDGRWADDALRLITRARLLRGEYVGATQSAEQLLELARSDGDRRRAAALLGRAVVGTGDAARADSLLSFALSGDLPEESRLEARVARAEARRRLGRFADADADYADAIRQRPDDPRLRLERFHLLLEAGRADDAAGEFRQLLRRPQRVAVEEDILTAADSFARKAPQAARAALAGAGSSPLRGSTQAGLITRRGELARAAGEIDSARADFRRAAAIAPGTNGAVAGQVALARLDLAQADSISDLAPVKERLDAAGRAGLGREVVAARQLAGRVERVRRIAELGDVGWLAAAEVARDSLDAPYLARALFLRFADELPTSVWAPKAILAALAVGPYPYGAPGAPSDDELRRRLRSEYASNPYVAAVDGSAGAEGEGGETAAESFASAERALDQRLRAWLGRIGIRPGRATPAVSDTTEELRRGTPPVN